MIKILTYILVYAFIAFVLIGLISLIRFACVHIKAYFIRRKLAKLSESEKKDD